MLFIEGQLSRGVFVLCHGKAKLSTTSREGKTIITKISDSGDVLGLNAVISNVPYEVTAEMMEPGQANFIPAGLAAAVLERVSGGRDAGGAAVEPKLLHCIRRDPNTGSASVAFREVRKTAAVMVHEVDTERWVFAG